MKALLPLSTLLFFAFDCQKVKVKENLPVGQTLEFSDTEMIIDQGSSLEASCPSGDPKAISNYFKSFELKRHVLSIHCDMGSNGGFHFFDEKTKEKFGIAVSSGRDGNAWQIQSLFFVKDSKLIQRTVTYTVQDNSYQCTSLLAKNLGNITECGTEVPYTCSREEAFFEINGDRALPIKYKDTAPDFSLKPFKYYQEKCMEKEKAP